MNSELLIILNLCLTFVVFGVSGSCDLGTYGRNCEKNCSQYCASDIDEYVHCDQGTGHCSEGCVPGWYGGTCMLPCSSHCNNRTCNQQTGRCTLGCVEDHTGDYCEKENEIEKRTGTTATTIAIIATATTIAIIAAIAIAIIVAVKYRRRKRRRSNGNSQEHMPLHNMGQGANVSTVFETPDQQDNGVTPNYEGEEPNGNTELHDACNRGNLSQVKSILSQGSVDINRRGTDGRTAVMLAAQWGHRYIFNVIMENKPDVSKFDRFGNSILHLACLGGEMKIVKYVLSQNLADINSKNIRGETPVMLAALQGDKQLLLFLLKQRADMLPLDIAGNNILHLACCGGNIEVVNYVLSQNIVHIDSRSHEGKTPAMMAAEKKRKSVLNLLKSNGADLSLKDNFSNDVYQLARRNEHGELISEAAPSTRGCEVM